MAGEPTTTTEIQAGPRPSTAGESRDSGILAAYLNRPTYDQIWAVANMLAGATLVPQHFQKQPANCFIAIQLASRLGIDPFMAMQGMYVVQGKPGMEGKLIIALVNNSGLFKDPLEYSFTGAPRTGEWTCTVSATRVDTGKVCSLAFEFQTAIDEGWVAKGGSKWKTIPDQMMRYRAAAFFARVYCPEVIMGMQTREELEDIDDGRPTVTMIEPKAITAKISVVEPTKPAPEPAPVGPAPQAPTSERPPGVSTPVNGPATSAESDAGASDAGGDGDEQPSIQTLMRRFFEARDKLVASFPVKQTILKAIRGEKSEPENFAEAERWALVMEEIVRQWAEVKPRTADDRDKLVRDAINSVAELVGA